MSSQSSANKTKKREKKCLPIIFGCTAVVVTIRIVVVVGGSVVCKVACGISTKKKLRERERENHSWELIKSSAGV